MPRNITNGQFELPYNEEDRVDEKTKFQRAPAYDSIDYLRHENKKTKTNYFIQNIRTGAFSEISQNYMLESKKEKEEEPEFVTNSFDAQLKMLWVGLQEKMTRVTTFFQGLFAGMALLYTITLNLSATVSTDLVRVEDQALRIISLLSSFGSMYSFLISKRHYQFVKVRGTSAVIDPASKAYVLCTFQMLFYTASYVLYNVSHTYAVEYNINQEEYSALKASTTAYTAVGLVAWIITNVNTYKYQTEHP